MPALVSPPRIRAMARSLSSKETCTRGRLPRGTPNLSILRRSRKSKVLYPNQAKMQEERQRRTFNWFLGLEIYTISLALTYSRRSVQLDTTICLTGVERSPGLLRLGQLTFKAAMRWFFFAFPQASSSFPCDDICSQFVAFSFLSATNPSTQSCILSRSGTANLLYKRETHQSFSTVFQFLIYLFSYFYLYI